MIVCSSGPDENNENRLTLWVQKSKQWEKKHFFTLDQTSEKQQENKLLGATFDVSWGLLNGRSFHYVVSCGENGVFVWKFQLVFEYQGQDKNKTHFFTQEEIPNVKNVLVTNISCRVIKMKESIALKATWNYLCNVVVVSFNNKSIQVYKKNEEDEWLEFKQICSQTKNSN